MNAALIAAGCLGVVAAAVHGGAGEALVVRKVLGLGLPPTALGGPAMTRAMIHVSWHIGTVAFLVLGAALLLSGSVLEGEMARAVALVAAAGFTGFAAVVLVLGGAAASPRALFRHPGPAVLAGTAALAWLGAL